jgi:anhydro-N-acetylmuramic acid kinase
MRRNSRIVIGLNSGTSADGVDAGVCEITGRGLAMRVKLIGHNARPYSPQLRKRVLAIMAPARTTTQELCLLHREIGMAFATTARAAMRRFSLKRVDLIGSHGQTICHLPPGRSTKRNAVSATLQIGDAATISMETGARVVSDFRMADIAAGGQGAPLVPWTDYVLFRDKRRNRVLQNIGGIANLTWLPAGGGVDDVIAFDTGPGNMVLDALVRYFTKDREQYDANGRMSARGDVQPRLLARWMKHPFFKRKPPRSCGREEFGESWVQAELAANRKKYKSQDWIATAAAFTALSIVDEYVSYLRTRKERYPVIDEVILCCGGANNRTVVSLLEGLLDFHERRRVVISTTDDYGIPTASKECVSFAMLAAASLDGVPANLPRVTGAKRRVVLGQQSDCSRIGP